MKTATEGDVCLWVLWESAAARIVSEDVRDVRWRMSEDVRDVRWRMSEDVLECVDHC